MAVSKAGTSRKQPQTGPRDVFVSYTSADELVARAVVEGLEARDLGCFVMFRDIPKGTSRRWNDFVVPALDKAGVVLLLYSSHTRSSVNVRREVEYAQRRIPVLSLRIDNASPPHNLEIFLPDNPLDASTDPLEVPMEDLATAVRLELPSPSRQSGKPRVSRPQKRPQGYRPEPESAPATVSGAWSQCLIGGVSWRFRVGSDRFPSLGPLVGADEYLAPSEHDDPSQSLAVSSDGLWAATLSGDGTLRISTINRITGAAACWREIQMNKATFPDGTCRLLAAAGRGIGEGVKCIVSTPKETIEVICPSPLKPADFNPLAPVPSLAAAYVACRHLLVDADGKPAGDVLTDLLKPHRITQVLGLDAGQVGPAHTYLAVLGEGAKGKPALLTAVLEGPADRSVAFEVCQLAAPADRVVVVRSKRAQKLKSVCVLTAEGSAVKAHYPFCSCQTSGFCRRPGA